MSDRHIGYLFKIINDKMKISADANMKSHNLTFTQSRVLVFLYRCEGQATQKEIEENLEVSHPTVVGIVSRMEQNGYVTSWLDPQNKRNKIVKMTEKAFKINEKMDEEIEKQERKMFASLSQEEIDHLEKTLQTIYKNLS